MKIIAVYGVGNSGKTTSIKRFVDKFINEQNSFSAPEFIGEKNKNDIICKTVYNSVIKVGITSQGDTKEFVEIAFEKMTDCDIVICACRTKGGSEKYLEKRAKDENGYILWIGKARVSLWEGNKAKTGAETLQDQAIDYTSEMIYKGFQLIVQKE